MSKKMQVKKENMYKTKIFLPGDLIGKFSQPKIGFDSATEGEQTKIKLIVLKDLLKECQDQHVKTWLRDKINELLIEIL